MKKTQKTSQTIVFILTITLLISCKKENKAIETNRPNILIAIMDDATYEHMGIYGCDWIKTPNFDRIAKEGLLFSRAYTPNAKCAPSRSIILTGRNSWQLEEAANHWAYFPTKFKKYDFRLNTTRQYTLHMLYYVIEDELIIEELKKIMFIIM